MLTRYLLAAVLLLAIGIPIPARALPYEHQVAGPSQSPSSAVPVATGIGYGVIVSNLANLDRVQGLGFNWVKFGISWRYAEPSRGSYNWGVGGLDAAVTQALARGLKILVRVDDPPEWATGTTAFNAPPLNDDDFADFLYNLASRYRGRVRAYEIWNEPNVSTEWGGQYPSPVKYGQMLRALYPRVKQGDPDAQVVTGGLANVGDGNSTNAYGDLLYIKHLYDPNNNGDLSAGAKGFFDAIGSHPYGGPNPPEQSPWPTPSTGSYFQRAWQHHQMAEVWGLEEREIWVTEFGWLLDPGYLGRNCDSEFGSHFVRFKVDAATQADYTVRAFQYAATNWPWIGPMILMNLDLSMDSWRSGCEVLQYFSLLNADGTPRPVYTALANMPKTGVMPPGLRVRPQAVTFLIQPADANTTSASVSITNSGDGVLTWTASKTSQSWFDISPTSGTGSSTLTVTANKAGMSNGNYTGSISVNATGASPSGATIPVVLYIGAVYRAYVPGAFERNTAGW